MDPYAAIRLDALLEDMDDAFSSDQLAVSSRWRRYEAERAEEAAARRKKNEQRKKKKADRSKKSVTAEVELNACRRRKITNWD